MAKFSRNRHFCRKPPGKRLKKIFSPFLLFFFKIYPYLVSFDQFWAPKVILASKYSQILISLDPPFLPIFQYPVIQNMGKSRKIQMAAISWKMWIFRFRKKRCATNHSNFQIWNFKENPRPTPDPPMALRLNFNMKEEKT